MNRIKIKNHNIGSHRINKICLSSYNHKKYMYLKMDIVDYHIFMNLFVSHMKNNFVEYRQYVLIFALVRTVTLFMIFSML